MAKKEKGFEQGEGDIEKSKNTATVGKHIEQAKKNAVKEIKECEGRFKEVKKSKIDGSEAGEAMADQVKELGKEIAKQLVEAEKIFRKELDDFMLANPDILDSSAKEHIYVAKESIKIAKKSLDGSILDADSRIAKFNRIGFGPEPTIPKKAKAEEKEQSKAVDKQAIQESAEAPLKSAEVQAEKTQEAIKTTTQKEFADGLAGVKTQKELFDYLAGLESVKVGPKSSIYFPSYSKKIQDVFDGNLSLSEIDGKDLRVKIKEIISNSKGRDLRRKSPQKGKVDSQENLNKEVVVGKIDSSDKNSHEIPPLEEISLITEDFKNRKVGVRKIGLKDGSVSDIGIGEKSVGYCTSATEGSIKVGDTLVIVEDSGGLLRTSKINKIYKVADGHYVLETQTSAYDLVVERNSEKIDEVSAEDIASANSFEDLADVIEKSGGIVGTGKSYKPLELVHLINEVKSGTVNIDHVTRKNGLRHKVQELLNRKNGVKENIILDGEHTVIEDDESIVEFKEKIGKTLEKLADISDFMDNMDSYPDEDLRSFKEKISERADMGDEQVWEDMMNPITNNSYSEATKLYDDLISARKVEEAERFKIDAIQSYRMRYEYMICEIDNRLNSTTSVNEEARKSGKGDLTPEVFAGGVEEIKKELNEMPEAEKENLDAGFGKIANVAEVKKNNFFADLYSSVAKAHDSVASNKIYNAVIGKRTAGFRLEKWFNDKFSTVAGFFGSKDDGNKQEHLAKKSFGNRFFLAIADSYKKNSERAERQIKDAQEGKSLGVVNVMKLSGNILKYGRLVADLCGLTPTSASRLAMFGAMGLSKVSEATLEARLNDARQINKTRYSNNQYDVNKAMDEAWALYEKAGNKGNVTAESLKKAFSENLPQDILNRFKSGVDTGKAYNMIESITGSFVKKTVGMLNDSLEAIDNGKGTQEEKTAQKMRVMKRYEKHLQDLDRMVTQYGQVDTFASVAKIAELGSKAAVAGLTVQSMYLLTTNIPKMFNSILGVFSGEGKAPAGVTDNLVSKMSGKSHLSTVVTTTEQAATRPSSTLNTLIAHETGTTGVKSGVTATADAIKSTPTGTGAGRTAEVLAGKTAVTAETFKIGSRGPEGTIIDHLKAQGMSKQEAGVKAHKMFTEWMHSAEGKKFLGDKLPNMEINDKNYLEAMKHIKDGAIEITSEGKMKIVDARLLKFVVDHEPGAKLEMREFDSGVKDAQGSIDYGKKAESLMAELAKAKKELEGDVDSFLHDEYPRGIGNGVSAEEYLKDHPDADGITHKFVRDDVLRIQDLERQIAESKMDLSGAEDAPAGKGKVAEGHIADKQPDMKAGGKLQSMTEVLRDDARQAKFAEVLNDPSDKKALVNFIGKPNKYLYEDVSAVMGKKGEMRIEFSVKNDPVDVEMIITKDGKIAVDGHGFNNWPDTKMKPVPMTKENLNEALDFINGRGKFAEDGGAVAISGDAIERRAFEDMDFNGNGNGHEAVPESPKNGKISSEMKSVIESAPTATTRIDVDSRGTGTIEGSAVLKGTTGREFLKSDFMEHLEPGKAGMPMAMRTAEIASRDISSNLAQYKNLVDSNDPKAEEFRDIVTERWKNLPKGVLDMKKVNNAFDAIKKQ